MNPLLILPLLPLAAALWLAVSYRRGRRRMPGLFELAALAPIAAAAFAADVTTDVRFFLTTNVSVFELDTGARAALLLFGALWLVAGLLDRRRESRPADIPLLIALSAAITIALAREGPAVFYGMLVAGFGLCAFVASEAGTALRWPVRVLAAFLVTSYLLVFEVLLHVQAAPLAGMTATSAAMIILAVVLSGGIPPAHVWQTAALPRASAPTALLLTGIPGGIALTGGHKLLSGAGSELALACLILAVVGAAWTACRGALQRSALVTLAYATAATASLLLIGLPGGTAPAATPWNTLSLLAACSALVVFRLQRPGFTRNAGMTLTVIFHGVAAGQFAVSTANASAAIGGLHASLVAALATMLVTLTARRIAATPFPGVATSAAWLAPLLAALAAVGIGIASMPGAERLAAAWPAATGIGLGLLLSRLLPAQDAPGVSSEPPDGAAKGALLAAFRGIRRFLEYTLPSLRDRLQIRVLSLWQGKTWASRIARLESLLAVWPATALGMLLLAIAIGWLLLG